ncbi:MAG: hypothetical protein HYY39_07605 [Armatimonadetes bacterium]|nr:hypothetical protein [Armatimonadota bacterium]
MNLKGVWLGMKTVAVQVEHGGVALADDEQRRRTDLRQHRCCQVGAAATRHNGSDNPGPLRGRNQRRCGAGAGSEQPDRERPHSRVGGHPVEDVYQTLHE